MKRYYFSFFLLPFLVGCGNGSSSIDTKTEQSNISSSNFNENEVENMQESNTNITSNNIVVETTNMAVDIKRELTVSGAGYLLKAKVYIAQEEAKEFGSGKYNFYKTDNNLEIVYIEGGYSDTNNNSRLDTYEPYSPMMYTFSNYYNANPFTTFMVNIFGHYNNNDIVKNFGLDDRFTSFDFDVLRVSKEYNDIAKIALILKLTNVYLTNEESDDNVININNSTQNSGNSVNTTTLSSNILPNINRDIGFNSKFLNIYNNLKNSTIINPLLKLENAIKSTISNTNLFEAIDKIVNANENSTLAELEILIVPNWNIMNYNNYYEAIIEGAILDINSNISTNETILTPSTIINNSNITNILPEV